MTRQTSILSAFLSLAACGALPAQEAPQLPGPEREHQWLQQFVGQWESESEAIAESDQPPMKGTGTMSARMLGEFWVVCDVTATLGEMSVTAVQTIGYDPTTKKYVGTWIDSMVNHLWSYQGTVDDSGKILTLEAEGPNFMAGGRVNRFRDTYEFKSQDHIAVTSSMLDEDGKWVAFMTGNIRRKR